MALRTDLVHTCERRASDTAEFETTRYHSVESACGKEHSFTIPAGTCFDSEIEIEGLPESAPAVVEIDTDGVTWTCPEVPSERGRKIFRASPDREHIRSPDGFIVQVCVDAKVTVESTEAAHHVVLSLSRMTARR